ncbi:MAG: hypothetical protein WAU91_06525 [Desulfatitalea sp.]
MTPLNHSLKIPVAFLATALAVILFCSPAWADPTADFENKVKEWAMECRTEVITQFELIVSSGRLSIGQMFDTFYIPIPNTTPQKFRTQYDSLSDDAIQQILDKYLAKDPKIFFVVAVDRNGYLPTHNSNSRDRGKRLFNDRTGLAAAHNTEPVLIQKYFRDTGETIYDLSVPIFIHKKHWGAIRFGYKP